MKSNIMFGLAAAALTLTACSQEEILNNVESNPDVIGFSAVSNLTSRSADSYCNTNLPGAFNVVAITADGTEKFTDVAKGDGKGYTTEAAHYWGAEALNFHAYVNGTYSRDANGAYFKGFEPAANATEQLDLLYSVKNDVYRETVKLNFRHALSQIVFRAWNKSSLNVTISGVTIGHINSKGDFTFPTVNTEDNYENHELMADPTKQLEGQGTWDNVADSEFKNYTAKLNESITFTPNSEVGMITNVNHKPESENNPKGDLSMLLLPQQTKAWDPSQTGAAFNGAYFLLDVEFTNDKGELMNYKGITQAVIPADILWKQGVRYIYTFIFEDGGNGGYTPDPENPEPVLGGKISYEVSVDDFVPADSWGETEWNGTGAVQQTKEYTLTFQGNSPIVKTSTANEFVFSGNAPEATAEGKKFLGWAETEGGEVVLAAGAAYEVTLTSENPTKTYYPVFADEYTFTLTVGDQKVSKTTTEASATLKLTPESPVKEGHNFLGWATTPDATEATVAPNTEIVFEATVENPTITYYPVFEVATVEITLSFDTNGENTIASITKTVNYGEEATFTLPTNADVTTADESYSLEGWLTTPPAQKIIGANDPDVEGLYNPGYRNFKASKSMTLYAVYRETTAGSGGGGDDPNIK